MEIVSSRPELLPHFVALNREWIDAYFEVEPMDIVQLENAQVSILDQGGEILFVVEGEKVVGTCAMIPHGPGTYELAKMAVSPATQGKGYGNVLMKAAIDWARAKSAKRITLISNTILAPAIALYKKYGFETISLGQHPDYKRVNIEMELKL